MPGTTLGIIPLRAFKSGGCLFGESLALVSTQTAQEVPRSDEVCQHPLEGERCKSPHDKCRLVYSSRPPRHQFVVTGPDRLQWWCIENGASCFTPSLGICMCVCAAVCDLLLDGHTQRACLHHRLLHMQAARGRSPVHGDLCDEPAHPTHEPCLRACAGKRVPTNVCVCVCVKTYRLVLFQRRQGSLLWHDQRPPRDHCPLPPMTSPDSDPICFPTGHHFVSRQ